MCQGMMKAIGNSEDVANRFHENVMHMESSPYVGARVRSLRYAKHRFDSTSRPLGRLVLLFDAVWATATELLITRDVTVATYV